MDRFGDKVCCNPPVKLEKQVYYPTIDIEKITPGYKTVKSEETVADSAAEIAVAAVEEAAACCEAPAEGEACCEAPAEGEACCAAPEEDAADVSAGC